MNANSINQKSNSILIPESQVCFSTNTHKVCISVKYVPDTQINLNSSAQIVDTLSTQGTIGKGIGYSVGGLLGGLATVAMGRNPLQDSSIVKLGSSKGYDIGDYFIPF
mgnify:CR=1 FL=1